MSAVDTAMHILEWALHGSGPPPEGALDNTEQLAKPNEQLDRMLGKFAVIHAARLGFNGMQYRNSQLLSRASVILAAALGALNTPILARCLVTAAAPKPNAWEWITQHGLLNLTLPFLTGEKADLLDDFLNVSPLTAVLHHPSQGRQSDAFTAARQVLSDTAIRAGLLRALAEPSDCLAVLHWRQALLERLRLMGDAERDFVLNVYETAIIHHRQTLIGQIQTSRIALQTSAASDAVLQQALAVAAWWGPLAALERSYSDILRARRYLGYDYREGIALYRLAQRLRGITP